MKLIDKIKNYFYDDEEEENEINTKTEKKSIVKQESPKDNEEDKVKNNVSNVEKFDAISERELFKSDPTFNFPIIFDEDDFDEEKAKKDSIKERKFEQSNVIEGYEKKIFVPSPNISPIYGILGEKDSNLNDSKKDDGLLDFYDEKKTVDIDDVLGKVYSPSRVDLKSDNYNKKEEDHVVSDLSLDLFDSPKPEMRDEPSVNIDKKLKSIDELLEKTEDEDFYSLVDSMYKDEEENEEDDK